MGSGPGTTLEDFFAACCLPHVANWWRWHLRQLPPAAVELDALDEPGQACVLALVADHSPDPAAVAELRDLLNRTLASASPQDRMSFVLRDQGWSPAEIAHVLGIDRNALDPRMSRAPESSTSKEKSVSKKKGSPDPDATVIDGADAPIRSLSEDQLGRRPFAQALAAEVLAAPAARGYVMGLTGPRGSGKTSILNMTVDAIGGQAMVVQFNPWTFSGTEALVSSFFAEIGKQLRQKEAKFKAIAGKLATYGQLLSPLAAVVGAANAVQGGAKVLEELLAAPSVFEQHQELRSMLEDLDKRLIVVVDDVDRLRPQEVLDIVRLVRLVGDFPNTLYLLAFDRHRVEECLGEGNVERGRAYLEKIVQVTHDVPHDGSLTSPPCSSGVLRRCSMTCRPDRSTRTPGRTSLRSSSVPSL